MDDIRQLQRPHGPAESRGPHVEGGGRVSGEADALIGSRGWMRALRAQGRHADRRRPRAAAAWSASRARCRSAGSTYSQPLIQMHNRGNGKGGGIAAVGLDADQLGVIERILEQDYLIQVAYLKPEVREDAGGRVHQADLQGREEVQGRDQRRQGAPEVPGGRGRPRSGGTSAGRRRTRWTSSSRKRGLGGARPAQGRGRVRLPDQLQDQPEVLRASRACRRSSCPTAGTCS